MESLLSCVISGHKFFFKFFFFQGLATFGESLLPELYGICTASLVHNQNDYLTIIP